MLNTFVLLFYVDNWHGDNISMFKMCEKTSIRIDQLWRMLSFCVNFSLKTRFVYCAASSLGLASHILFGVLNSVDASEYTMEISGFMTATVREEDPLTQAQQELMSQG